MFYPVRGNKIASISSKNCQNIWMISINFTIFVALSEKRKCIIEMIKKIELIEYQFNFHERRKKKKKTLPNSLALKKKFLSLHPLLKGTPPAKAIEKRSLDIYIHIL